MCAQDECDRASRGIWGRAGVPRTVGVSSSLVGVQRPCSWSFFGRFMECRTRICLASSLAWWWGYGECVLEVLQSMQWDEWGRFALPEIRGEDFEEVFVFCWQSEQGQAAYGIREVHSPIGSTVMGV